MDIPLKKAPLSRNDSQDNSVKQSNLDIVHLKKKIVVIADDQGRHIQRTLQHLIEEKYKVTCFWKSGATLQDVLLSEHREISSLTQEDYVIVLGGVNDRSPSLFQLCIGNFLCTTRHTNVLFCEIPHNKCLHESKLNYELSFLCSKFVNAKYIDMEFSVCLPYKSLFPKHVCRFLLREILCNEYKILFNNANRGTIRKSCSVMYADKDTQTDFEGEANSNKNYCNDTEHFFRVQ